MSAEAILNVIMSQTDPNGRYGERYRFSPGEPSLQYNKYVRSNLFGVPAIIDMVHFFRLGYRGEVVGLGVELAQIVADPRSAMDPQDFFSNHVGSLYFRRYYRPYQQELSGQLRKFLERYESGLIAFPRPEGGMPNVPPEIRARLLNHTSEAISLDRFISYVSSLESWLQARTGH